MADRISLIKDKEANTLALQGRVFFHDRTGEIKDVTHDTHAGFRAFAEDGELAAHILQECRGRLGLLKVAASGSNPLEAAHVRALVDDLLLDLRDGSELSGYIERTAALLKNAEPLPSRVQLTAPRKACKTKRAA